MLGMFGRIMGRRAPAEKGMGEKVASGARADALARAPSPGALAAALAAYASLVGLSCTAMVAWLDPACALPARTAATAALDPALLLANALPPVLTCLVLLALTRRPLLSAVLVLLLLYVLYVANAAKLAHLDTPLLPADFVLLAHLGDGGALIARYMPRRVQMILVASVGAVALIALRERPWRPLRGLARGLLLATSLLLAGTLLLDAPPWASVRAKEGDDFLVWSPSTSARRIGLPATLVRRARDLKLALPEPDRAEARALLDRYPGVAHAAEPRAPPPGGWPDIIVLQSESFFDAARLRGLESNQVLPAFGRLAARSRHGNLWVPTYGGGTIRTEFEVLTGLAMRYFPDVQYPYFRLTTRPIASLARVLGARGYRTLAIHPHQRDFWNRAAAFANLGFEAFQGVEHFGGAARVGYYVADEALVDHVLGELERARQPQFLFAISMENHGPYHDYPNADPARLAAQPLPPGLDADAARDLQGYLHHLENADRALGRLADALSRRPRRSLLLFYGDHLPALPDVYAQAGFDDAQVPGEQPAPWLLYDTADRTASQVDTASFYLPSLLLERAGIADGGFFDVLDRLRRADAPARRWTPVDDDGLRALSLMRQRGERIAPPQG
ncbi:MAG: LTA synthase family protein [Lysobacteraceae bacterium]|nr:MAG: LTA synthase family protein [Xanthomonadaceae bacterium]